MKKIILFAIMLALFIGLVNAETQIITDPIKNPYSAEFNILDETGISGLTIQNCLDVDSCYVQSNYESKSCSYAYWCYAVLPVNSVDIRDAIIKECVDITEGDKVLKIKDFVPPKGVLYYVSTFITIVHYDYSDATETWTPTAEIPQSCGGHQLINAQDIRAICPEGQMLAVFRDPTGVIVEGSFGCYLAKKRCLDTLSTGLCTNPYDLFVLDLDGDGNFAEHYNLASAYCRDGDRNGVCDYVVDWDCPDDYRLCQYDADGIMQCQLGGNGVCDIWDYGVLASCEDDVLSPHSGICDDIDTGVCNTEFLPVCVAQVSGELVGGQTYPNSCYADSEGYGECPDDNPDTTCYVSGQCTIVDPECFVASDCQDLSVCIGGSSTGIDKSCIDYKCYYSGACGTSECQSNADCDHLESICVGIDAFCNTGGVCSIQGSCIQPPVAQKFSIWDLINQVFAGLIAFIKSIFT